MIKIKSAVVSVGFISALSLTTPSLAINLIEVYNQALTSDPTFKKAEADWMSARQAGPLAWVGTGSAGTGMFPNIALSGTKYKYKDKLTTPAAYTYYKYDKSAYTVALDQPIFNAATWSSIRGSKFTVRASLATYLSEGQKLMSRVANAYFEVLRAYENLQYTLANKKAVRLSLVTDLEKYRVGLIAVTAVYNAQSSYDIAIANEIRNRNKLRDKLEDLRAITGRFYSNLNGLPNTLPEVVPKPNNMQKWVEIALRQSYDIKSKQMTMLAYKQTILTTQLGRAPTLDLIGNYTHTMYDSGYSSGGTKDNSGYIGGSVSFPIFQGGYLFVQNKQDRANYLSSSDSLEFSRRTVVNNTRQSFLDVKTGITQIDADWQSVLAARKQLEATKAAYLVGSRTMVDVLLAISSLYNTKKIWAGDRYNYVESLIQLKLDAGTLSPQDLIKINRWLDHNLVMNYQQPNYKADPYYHVTAVELINPPKTRDETSTTSLSRAKKSPTKSTTLARNKLSAKRLVLKRKSRQQLRLAQANLHKAASPVSHIAQDWVADRKVVSAQPAVKAVPVSSSKLPVKVVPVSSSKLPVKAVPVASSKPSAQQPTRAAQLQLPVPD